MPWYKVEARHGPGHQSRTVYYVWQDHELSEDEKKELFEESFSDLDWPVGDVFMIKKLPKEVYIEKLHHYESSIKAAKRMLKILSETEPEELWECNWCHLSKISGKRTPELECERCRETYNGRMPRYCPDCCRKHDICCNCRLNRKIARELYGKKAK